MTPVPGGGQNYSGGSSWAPGFPYRLQQEGLAGARLGALAALRSAGVPARQAAVQSRGMASRAMASLPSWARNNPKAAVYVAALQAAKAAGRSDAQARSIARQVLDSI